MCDQLLDVQHTETERPDLYPNALVHSANCQLEEIGSEKVQTPSLVKFLRIHQLMHRSVVLKKNNIKFDIKTAPTCFGVYSYTVVRERIN